MDWNEEPIDDVDPMAERDAAVRRAPRPRRAPRQVTPILQGGPMQGIAPFMGLISPHIAAQGSRLGGMINQVQGVLQRENDSRVAQAREARRLEHEKAMRRMELGALLERVRQAGGR